MDGSSPGSQVTKMDGFSVFPGSQVVYSPDKQGEGVRGAIAPGKNIKLEIPDHLIFSKIRGPGCRGSIRLVTTVCLNQFSDFIIIKNSSKSNFYIKFVEKSLKFV